ncbi:MULTISPECIES: chloride channel protein [Chryseobacterium]|uniref:H(+)/Cl(-) exchange transporter ClcA n=1 Tax=Chryseobacterium fistulae TaxID=2675058 RepID=A0A6N4XNZ1_9FLAO|nr:MULTISPECIES: chloride channel protein [Chryseobacterium]CAA7387852.1 H(+)/Cl(-) exchange transporter ClcA [Chryseobacterium fistulae]CAD0224594.1 Chloride channel protein, CIC family [Chryseobacterium sp. JV274]
MRRKSVQRHHYLRLVLISVLISICASFLSYSLKIITEHFQKLIFYFAKRENSIWFIFLPTIGITTIYFLRKYLFLNRKNKGITEIYKTVDQRKDHLPLFKIPSHYFNGFLTVIFGGSTGIEVSTVVATATLGNAVYERHFSANIYKLELICAGVVAGVAILFGSPIAGWLFAMEVIARKFNKTLFMSCTASAVVSWIFLYFIKSEPLLPIEITEWKWMAIPFFVILSLLGGVLSVYFTILVIKIKDFFSGISNNFLRVNLGALIVGGLIFSFPFLYGDSYHSLSEILNHPKSYSFLFLLFLIILKPLASSLTLGAGGDGGVFAPSIVSGAFLGFTFAFFCNTFLGTSLIYVNFMLVGAAATLSASIYAPFTALFLVCNLAPNGYVLFFPILLACWISKDLARRIIPYNVYTYYTKSE